ncbi:MAG: metallophosphoesterase, partial [Gammaproteobacteria bacterium]|nr:metallophosphoesterase [Gammaproteobacteria bacterium]
MLAAAPALAFEATSFVQVCDTQLGMGGYEADKIRFKLAVKAINALEVNWVVVCGDLVNNGEDDQAVADFKAIAEGFTAPCYLAPGNHDVGNEPTKATLERYRAQYGPDFFAVSEHGFKLMILNTQLWKAPVAGESEAHDAWFRKELADSRENGTPTLLVSHYPPFVETPDEEESYYNLAPAIRADLLAEAKAADVKAWLAGHVHKNVVRDFEGIPVVASATTS